MGCVIKACATVHVRGAYPVFYTKYMINLFIFVDYSMLSKNGVFGTVMHFDCLNFHFVANVYNEELPPFPIKRD